MSLTYEPKPNRDIFILANTNGVVPFKITKIIKDDNIFTLSLQCIDDSLQISFEVNLYPASDSDSIPTIQNQDPPEPKVRIDWEVARFVKDYTLILRPISPPPPAFF